MKQLLLKILKLFLIFTAVLLGILLVFGIVLSLKWPLWVGLFILIGILGLWLAVVLFRKIWLKRREQLFVSQVIEQDELYLKQMGSEERKNSQELQDRWKEAIEALKHSHLKKYGNPLYVLPWYMMIGESGSGKTTAIESARLSSPFAEINRTSGISGTRNCDWWFFEQAILIDTAGRWSIPVDEGRDKEEWQKFLTHLAKYRKKEPLNGLVVTIAADKLLESGPEVLEDDGKNIRRRVDELMRVLGARFPVYILVTKCDLIQGMNQFCDHISEDGVQQAMGSIKKRDQPADILAFIARAIDTIGERLRDYRLLLFHRPAAQGFQADVQQGIDPAPLLFPEEFERLKSGLEAFIRGAFQENPYQETPLLRGLFFSSGRQEGSPYSHFLKELGLIEEREILPGTNKGLFLHDLFSRILPLDRTLFTPTQRALDWNRLTKHLGLTSWLAFGVAVCGLLSFSFVSNLNDLRAVSDQFSKPIAFRGDILGDMPVLDGFREKIEKVSGRDKKWWIPSFGLSQGREAEVGLKERFCDQFQAGIIDPIDEQLEYTITGFSPSTADEVIGLYANHLVQRINLLKARLEGQQFETLQEAPQPSLGPIILQTNQTIMGDDDERFNRLYLYYLDWRTDTGQINQEMTNLQKIFEHLLIEKRPDMRWLVAWINQHPALEGERILLEHFWGEGLQAQSEAMVDPAFTPVGRDVVFAAIQGIEAALVDPLKLARKKTEFKAWYDQAYITAWQNFGLLFPMGQELLSDRNVWQQVAATMATDEGPYFLLLDTMAEQLEPLVQTDDNRDAIPGWLRLVFELKAAKLQAATEKAAEEKKSLLAKTAKKGKSILSKIDKKTGLVPGGQFLESRMAAGKAYYEYRNQLAEITPVASSPKVSFQMASQVFKQDSVTEDASFFKALQAYQKLNAALATSGPEQKMFWQLVIGPLDFLWQFAERETACQLQKLWEEEVLVEIQGISDTMSLKKILFDDPGYAVKFVKGPAAPFVDRSLKKGYHASRAMESTLPFDTAFLNFLNRGVKPDKPTRSNYYVKIVGRPFSANSDSRIQPHRTRLELQCADEPQILVNRQYRIAKTFDWSPQKCGDVLFQIEVGNLVLERRYTGQRAFAKFLKEFDTGQHIFSADNFPEHSAALKRLKIKTIKVKYDLSGHREVIQPPGTPLGEVPRNIISCWEQ